MRILQPQRGARAEYMRLVQKNAEQNLKAFLAHQEVQETAQARSLTELADALELPEPPHRIECYDISNIQGTNPVASMVVFVEGPAEEERVPPLQDSVRSRPERLRDDAGDAAPAAALPARAPTDRNRRRRVERELARKKEQLQQETRSAADRRRQGTAQRGRRGAGRAGHDRHPGRGVGQRARVALRAGPVRADRAAAELARRCTSCMRIRDEAHRFAVTYHRQRRAKAHDALGARRARRCRTGSQEAALSGLRLGRPAIKRASLDEIVAVKGHDAGAGIARQSCVRRITCIF